MLSQELLTKVIGFAAQAGDMDAVAELTGILNDTYINPAPEKKKRASNNTSGYCQLDAETGKLIAKFQTVKECNVALGKKETASNVSDALLETTSASLYSLMCLTIINAFAGTIDKPKLGLNAIVLQNSIILDRSLSVVFIVFL